MHDPRRAASCSRSALRFGPQCRRPDNVAGGPGRTFRLLPQRVYRAHGRRRSPTLNVGPRATRRPRMSPKGQKGHGQKIMGKRSWAKGHGRDVMLYRTAIGAALAAALCATIVGAAALMMT